MKRILVIFLFLSLSVAGQSQSIPTFNRFYREDTVTNGGYNIVKDGDSLVLISNFWNGNLFQGFYFAKIDLSGNEAYRTVLKKNQTVYEGIYGLDSHKTSSQEFIIGTSSLRSGTYYDSAVLIKLNNNLDIDYVKPVVCNKNKSYLNGSIELSDGNYLLTGQNGNIDSSGYLPAWDGWLVKTDTSGNIIWQKEEAHSTYSGFLYTGVFNGGFFQQFGISTPDNTWSSVIEIRKYDNDGNLIWLDSLGIPGHANAGGPMIVTKDGGLIQVINILDTASPSLANITMPAVIYKFDSNGNIIWQKWFPYGDINSLTETKSGSIVLAESMSVLNTNPHICPNVSGALLKLDKNGNPLWEKWYVADSDYLAFFYDVTESSDGGIVAIGQGVNPAFIKYDTWVVKADSNGCLNGDCPRLYSAINEIQDEQARFLVFPNPANSQFTVAITETSYMQDYRDLTLMLYDVTGRLVKQSEIRTQTATIYRDELSSGIYLWQLTDDERVIKNGKILLR